MFELTVKRRFAAAHRLEGYGGQCSALHGHTWTVEVAVTGRRLDSCGMLVDFKTLKEVIDGVIRQFDHSYLNELGCFNGGQGKINPTAENLAAYIYREIKEALAKINPDVSPGAVRIWESPDASALYRED
ncbi:MAG: 6-carboxytetrahydropterin synthase QueD [Peptococcaceae bacterium]|nr:6-carboxytetrahydropterin synthase QueD [Peptococcaceae bacterium]